jgi:hypothetical protein
MWLSRHGPTTHGPPWACFFSLGFGHAGQQSQKPRENLSISSMLFAHCPSALASNSLYKTPPKKNKKKTMQVHDWLRHRVVFFACVFFGLDAKAEEQVQTTLKKLIVFNGFANEEYILIYTYGF